MRARRLFVTVAALAIALPALAQDQNAAAPAPATNTELPATNESVPANSVTEAPRASARSRPTIGEDLALVELTEEEALEIPPPVEIPDHARRDPFVVGPLDPAAVGLPGDPWRGAHGAFLSTLMRRMNTPLPSRWAHIAIRNGLLARSRSPLGVHPADWAAERAWLLLRMGEADAARMIVSGVDVDRFTPKMYQVALQSALASADPSAMCPLEAGLEEVEPRVFGLVQAMCAALAGEPESAAAQIETARRRGRVETIDLVLAQKVVGAGTNTGRAVTVEWEPVERLNSWRFGLATATGMAPPERLVAASSPQLRAWQARSPLLSTEQRLQSARIAAGLGVFSSQSLVDLYSAIYDSTDPQELPQSDAWHLRLAFVGRDRQARLAALRRLWGKAGDDPYGRVATWALTARASTLVAPDPELATDAPNLISAMLSAGYDREAARWAGVVRQINDDRLADQSWALLALAAPEVRGIDVSIGRINAFIDRDTSRDKKRSALLVAGLAGLGRIDAETAGRLNRRYDLGLHRRSSWTRTIDAAANRRQAGAVLILAGTGMQTAQAEALPPAQLFNIVAALRNTGQEYVARMIAAEVVART